MREIDPGPDFPGTAPSPLEPLHWRAADLEGDVEVLIRMLTGEVIHGRLRHEAHLELQGSLLPVHLRSSELMISMREIRAVEMQALLKPGAAPLAMAAAHSEPAGREATDLAHFHLCFVDGMEWNGTTLGHRVRHRGLQLHVRLPEGSYKPVWIPRSALKSARFHGTPAHPLSPPRDHVPPPPPEAVAAEPSTPARNVDELDRMVQLRRRRPIRAMEDALLELRLADASQIDALQRELPEALHGHSEKLVRMGMLSPDQLAHVQARMASTPEVDALNFQIEPAAFERLPLKMASSHEVLPLGSIDGLLYVAAANPMDHDLERQLRVLANCSVSLVWAARTQIVQRLVQQARPNAAPARHAGDAPPSGGNDIHALLDAAMTEYKVQGAEERDLSVDESSSLVKLVTRMIRDAYAQKASDVHIETNPGEESLRIRFRKDGELEDYLRMPGFLRASLVSRIKVMSRLDISEKRRPQDGKINFQDYSPLPLELRVAVLPTHDGLEDVVMRLLASSRPTPLPQLGLSERDDAVIKRLAERSFGLLLACGPTGSGKTTTLHSILAHINTDNRKIWTAEDPIEITHPGLRQLHVNPKIGVTFASAMRAFLRADPDVIMIGEIRDQETASIAVEASLTGHLVLSTLHTNSAAESIVRLLDMGMDPMNFADSLLGIVAQRLVRTLCPRCAQPTRLAAPQIEALLLEYIEGSEIGRDAGWARLLAAGGVSNPDQLQVWNSTGCEHCHGTGYKGRTGVYEILENTPALKRLIQTRAGTGEILSEALRHGMRSLRQDALEKVVQGKIDLRQARTAYL
jgi:type II secretory ATPase GspE/PulE/Tfp pilus assembly ATPase PilB-like protein